MPVKLGNYQLVPFENRKSVEPGSLVVDIREHVFVTTGQTLEVATDITTVVAAFATPKGTSVGANDVLSVDPTISSGAVTVSRPASGTSALPIYVVIIGFIRSTSA